jgi:hypothetical protein
VLASFSGIARGLIGPEKRHSPTLGFQAGARFREGVPTQPVDATPANRLIGQHFSQGTDLSELYSIKPKQDSVFRLH